MELWVAKYKPSSPNEILSQQAAVSEVVAWLSHWKRGKPMGKALFLAGPPGTGKTTIAEVMAKSKGWALTQINASDERNAGAIEASLTEASKNTPLFYSGKIILIDEVDGISSGDRGGVAAIVKILKESMFPIIVTANDAYVAKLQPLRHCSKMVKLSRIDPRSIEKRLKEICEKEGVHVEGDVLKTLARWSSGDMRSAINDLQMMCKGKKSIGDGDFESLGFRERESNIFSVLTTVFRSKNANAARTAIQNCDKDPDDVFWWVENNIPLEFKDADSLSNAYEILSKADLFRQMVMRQQNWRFRLHMIDMLAGISLSGEATSENVQYKSPDKFMFLAMLKFQKAEMKSVFSKLSAYAHCPQKIAKNEYLPYLRAFLSGKPSTGSEGLELTKQETELILSGS
jgi:replication factor C large subunit